MDRMAHPFFGAVMDLRGRSFWFAFFVGALAASVAITVHGAPHHHDQTLVRLKQIVSDLRNCDTAATLGATVGRGGNGASNSDAVHTRALCPSRYSFDYDHLRIPENLTTAECSCQGHLCLPLDDYRCTTLRHRFPVEYKNGTQAVIELPVACACARPVTSAAFTGISRNS
ncbi:hypothetical protein HPB49_000898 [Dermacentor silvarum]|uniref:Uncharacterized protein n=1 Tax=Dermacentor silvarum TaxID=543639 RepID=A0ACB8DM16_DERSI|nr:hypothetical protein HPB49_000898 [Dermacentor silvarum]